MGSDNLILDKIENSTVDSVLNALILDVGLIEVITVLDLIAQRKYNKELRMYNSKGLREYPK